MTNLNSAAWCRRTTLAAAAVLAGLAPAHAQRAARKAKAKMDLMADRVDRTDSLALRKIFDEALLRGESYENLRYLTGTIGGRLSGSPQAQQAVEWGKITMEKAGFDRVYLQEVMVPHWVRGSKERGEIVGNKGKEIKVAVCALGGSVGTNGKLKAGVVEVHSFDEAQQAARRGGEGQVCVLQPPLRRRAD
ncbi:hypothetical protein ACFQT0_15905 [Hymenobacter humi]|uniref:Peptidase M28 family protein n=1 Tax=Hymenobacter humi TaxID=1411620 RepID=A0ABW2U735_9BACT